MSKNLPAFAVFNTLVALLRIAGWTVKVRPSASEGAAGHYIHRKGVIVVATYSAEGIPFPEYRLVGILLHEVGHSLWHRPVEASQLDNEVLAEAFYWWATTGDLAAAIEVGERFLEYHREYYTNYYGTTDENPQSRMRWLRSVTSSAKGQLVRKLVLATGADRA